jgi:hypothetical protein
VAGITAVVTALTGFVAINDLLGEHKIDKPISPFRSLADDGA